MSTPHPNQALLTQAALLQAHAAGFTAGRTALITAGLRSDRIPLGFVEPVTGEQRHAGGERVRVLGITATGAVAVKRYGTVEFWPSGFLLLDDEKGPETKLNDTYQATFAPDGKTFKVGCQTFNADILEGLIAFRDKVKKEFVERPALTATTLGATWTPPPPRPLKKPAAKKAPVKKTSAKKTSTKKAIR